MKYDFYIGLINIHYRIEICITKSNEIKNTDTTAYLHFSFSCDKVDIISSCKLCLLQPIPNPGRKQKLGIAIFSHQPSIACQAFNNLSSQSPFLLHDVGGGVADPLYGV
jgi:hypothetical protein